jgi:hypothetical protein
MKSSEDFTILACLLHLRLGVQRQGSQAAVSQREQAVTDETVDFSVMQRDTGDAAPGATAAFPYDRMTVERFRQSFPRARWRDDLGAWFVPGKRAERRLLAWSGREWSGVLAYADQRGRDAFSFEPITSPYLETGDGLKVRTPYSGRSSLSCGRAMGAVGSGLEGLARAIPIIRGVA